MNKQEKRASVTPSLPSALEGEWRVSSVLGEGGQGIALLLDRRNKSRSPEKAVIKILKRGSTNYHLERMKREIQVLNEIEHPNVIKPIEWDSSEFPQWYLMPYYGQSLQEGWKLYRRRYKDNPIAMFTESVRIIRSLLLGLKQLHDCNYVHRDIKPGNIILSKSGEVLLIDFGIVYHPEFEPITSGRGAGNRFVLISSSIKASPYVDCLCMASLWVWLVSRDANISYGHYHWKYIELLGDDWRYEIIRAILANCSHELSSPKNAGQMLEMLDAQYNLKSLIGEKNVFETEVRGVLVAQTRAITQTELEKIEQRERLEATAAIARVSLELLKDRLEEIVSRFQEQGVKVSFKDLLITGNPHSQDNLLNNYFLQLLNHPPRTDVPFICITGGIDKYRFYRADLYLHLTDQQVEDELGLVIYWKLISRRGNTGSTLERKFTLTKQLSFKTISNAEAPEYQPTELASLLQDDLLFHMTHI